MDCSNDTTEHIKNKHLSYGERVKIEMRLKDGWSAHRIAKYELQCAANTVRNEIERGTVLLYDTRRRRDKKHTKPIEKTAAGNTRRRRRLSF